MHALKMIQRKYFGTFINTPLCCCQPTFFQATSTVCKKRPSALRVVLIAMSSCENWKILACFNEKQRAVASVKSKILVPNNFWSVHWADRADRQRDKCMCSTWTDLIIPSVLICGSIMEQWTVNNELSMKL